VLLSEFTLQTALPATIRACPGGAMFANYPPTPTPFPPPSGLALSVVVSKPDSSGTRPEGETQTSHRCPDFIDHTAML